PGARVGGGLGRAPPQSTSGERGRRRLRAGEGTNHVEELWRLASAVFPPNGIGARVVRLWLGIRVAFPAAGCAAASAARWGVSLQAPPPELPRRWAGLGGLCAEMGGLSRPVYFRPREARASHRRAVAGSVGADGRDEGIRRSHLA